MNVFLWQSYGSDLIIQTENDADISCLIDRIETIASGLSVEREIEHLRTTLNKHPTAIRVEITKFFNRYSDYQAFEHGRFHNTTRLP